MSKRMGRVEHNERGEKCCCKCRCWLSVDKFYPHTGTWDKLHPKCIECHNARRLELSRKRGVVSYEQRRTPYNAKGEKLCRRCKLWLNPEEFPGDITKWDQRGTACKQCCCKLSKQHRDGQTSAVKAAQGRERYARNLQYKLRMNLKNRIWFALKGAAKSAHTLELIGCTLDELKLHLEKQFKPGMSWANHSYRGWHIDHIRPCASFDLTDPEQQKQCFNYTNLQPMWAKENQSKGDTYSEPDKQRQSPESA